MTAFDDVKRGTGKICDLNTTETTCVVIPGAGGSQWNYQFTRALSLRAIMQYNGLLANPTYSSLRTTKNLSSDFLISYLVHPVYVGYNSNLENLVPSLCLPVAGQ